MHLLQVLVFNSDHALFALLAAEVPAPFQIAIIQRSHHKAFGQRIGVAQPGSCAQGQDTRPALDRDLEELHGFGAQKLLARVRQLSRDLV